MTCSPLVGDRHEQQFGPGARVDRRTDDRNLEGYLAECRELVLAEIRRLFDGRDERREVLYDLILDYPLREGKGLRPALSIALCCGLGGTVDAVLPSAATLELYHNAFLIHDDIEDESLLRRGEPTLHVTKGVPIAVNVGDAMLCLSLQPLLDNTAVIGLGPALDILQYVARMTRESVEGQALELEWVEGNRWDLTDDDYLEMVVQKTGWYSFITPLVIGALAAEAEPAWLDDLIALGTSMSLAFQITDDVLNLAADPEEYGKEIGGDLWEGKRTLLLLHALRSANDSDRRRALDILAKPRPPAPTATVPAGRAPADEQALLDRLVASGDLTVRGRRQLSDGRDVKTLDDIRFLAELIREHGSGERARAIASAHTDRAATRLAAIDWLPPSRHRRLLTDLVGYLEDRSR